MLTPLERELLTALKVSISTPVEGRGYDTLFALLPEAEVSIRATIAKAEEQKEKVKEPKSNYDNVDWAQWEKDKGLS